MARRFNYEEGCSDDKKRDFRERTVRNNRDRLYFDERGGQRYDLQFGSTLVREWQDVLKSKYSKFREVQDDTQIRLRSMDGTGTITLYPFVRVLVHGQIMEGFERDFPQMKQAAQGNNLTAQMERVALNEDE